MTTAVFCEKDLVAANVKYISNICRRDCVSFLKKQGGRYFSIQSVELKCKGCNRNNIEPVDELYVAALCKLNPWSWFFLHNRDKLYL